MIIRLADCPSQPWKNGLGRTREIAVQPSAAGSDDFLWRVSIAEVDSAAPFSSFPGIDRQIALLDGAGFTMTLDNGTAHALTTPFAPFAFAGEVKVDVSLADGPTRDFNLMVRRAQAHGAIRVWRETESLRFTHDMALLYCAAGQVGVAGEMLRAGDSWINSSARPMEMTLPENTVVFTIHVEPLDATSAPNDTF
jgi:environmental stress-induced protein Ves